MIVFLPHGKSAGKASTKYDIDKLTPVIRCSICNGEQVAGFRDRQSGRFTEIMLLRSEDDLRMFCEKYGITENIKRIY